MFFMIGLAAVAAATLFGHWKARQFVRDRLRFVDAAQSPMAPIIGGVGAAIVAGLALAFVPFFGFGTACVFGLGVGTGVAAGARDIRKGITAG